MKGAGIKFLVSVIWILNMVFFFGSLYLLFQNENGELPTTVLLLVGALFIFFIYLIKDIISFKRTLFLKIAGIIFIICSIYYIFIKNYVFAPVSFISGFLILKYLKKEN